MKFLPYILIYMLTKEKRITKLLATNSTHKSSECFSWMIQWGKIIYIRFGKIVLNIFCRFYMIIKPFSFFNFNSDRNSSFTDIFFPSCALFLGRRKIDGWIKSSLGKGCKKLANNSNFEWFIPPILYHNLCSSAQVSCQIRKKNVYYFALICKSIRSNIYTLWQYEKLTTTHCKKNVQDSWIWFDQTFLGLGMGKLFPAR